jgi:hypothetical protein
MRLTAALPKSEEPRPTSRGANATALATVGWSAMQRFRGRREVCASPVHNPIGTSNRELFYGRVCRGFRQRILLSIRFHTRGYARAETKCRDLAHDGGASRGAVGTYSWYMTTPGCRFRQLHRRDAYNVGR